MSKYFITPMPLSCKMHVVGVTIGVDLAGLLGGRMASAEGGPVPSGWGVGRGVPSPAD